MNLEKIKKNLETIGVAQVKFPVSEIFITETSENTFNVFYIHRGRKTKVTLNSISSVIETLEEINKIKMIKENKLEDFKKRVVLWLNRLHIDPLQITIKVNNKFKRIEGRCNWVKKELSFKREIIEKSKEVQDMIIVHEILHFFDHAHTKVFYMNILKVLHFFGIDYVKAVKDFYGVNKRYLNRHLGYCATVKWVMDNRFPEGCQNYDIRLSDRGVRFLERSEK
ncbi:MAG: YgjP-like metallopeptidase domain-containing protein [Candidatus Helarchaeota archaeon]